MAPFPGNGAIIDFSSTAVLARAGAGLVNRTAWKSSTNAGAISAASKSGACCPTRAAAWSARSSSSITWGRCDFAPGIPRTVDVRPHPHIGLATVTYLFEGEIMHRDSVGSEQAIRPGEVNWMTAGRGITHSERFEKARARGRRACTASRPGSRCRTSTRKPSPRFAHHGSRRSCPCYEERRRCARLRRRRGIRPHGERHDALAAVLRALGA